METSASKPATRITCIKCKQNPSNIKIRQAHFCKACFQLNFVTKFKSNLSKSSTPLSDQRDKLLVAFSGGPSSRALLDLSCKFQMPSDTGKLHQKYTDLVIAHIDETILFPDINEAEILAAAKEYPFKVVSCKLEDVFSVGQYQNYFQTCNLSRGAALSLKPTKLADSSSPKDLLLDLFQNIKSVTSREYLLSHIKNYLALKLAKGSGCHVVVVGDSSSKIAFNSILGISQGRGFSLPFDVSGESQLDPDTFVVRPLKNTLSKEIAYYNHLLALKSVSSLTFTTKAIGSNVSLGHTTEAFMNMLDVGYSATIPTVTSTVAKLKINSEILENQNLNKCIICSCYVSSASKTWKSNFSVETLESNSDQIECAPSSLLESEDDVTNVSSMLCYACTTLVEDISPGTCLPGFVYSKYEQNAPIN